MSNDNILISFFLLLRQRDSAASEVSEANVACEYIHLDYDLRIFAPKNGSKKIISSELTSLPSVMLLQRRLAFTSKHVFCYLVPTVALGKHASRIPNTSGNYPVF